MLKNSVCRLYLAMSKPRRRNRNIQSLSFLDKVKVSNLYDHTPQSEIYFNRETVFGEDIEEELSPPFYKGEYDPVEEIVSTPQWKTENVTGQTTRKGRADTDLITARVSEIKLIKSLSSSPSWSDDNDIEASRRVQDELEYMDRVLRGIDPIPLHYDVDEYKQWMETFPHLSLFGKKEFGPFKIWKEETKDSSEEHFSHRINSSNGRNKHPMRNLKQYKEEIKKAVIHNIYENISLRLNNTPPSLTSNPKDKTHHVSDLRGTQSYLNDCLKNSPFTSIINERYRKNCFISRQSSLEDDRTEKSPRFESLPLMIERQNVEPIFKRLKPGSNALTVRRSRRSIILPPINDSNINSSSQFRSISATPTYSSLLSAKSLKLESKILSGKSRNIPQF